MMSTKITLDHGDIDIDLPAEGQRPRGCDWNESVCTDTPTHTIVVPDHDEDASGPHASTYCARHYAVSLAELLTLHVQQCSGGVREHLSAYGEISAPRRL